MSYFRDTFLHRLSRPIVYYIYNSLFYICICRPIIKMFLLCSIGGDLNYFYFAACFVAYMITLDKRTHMETCQQVPKTSHRVVRDSSAPLDAVGRRVGLIALMNWKCFHHQMLICNSTHHHRHHTSP